MIGPMSIVRPEYSRYPYSHHDSWPMNRLLWLSKKDEFDFKFEKISRFYWALGSMNRATCLRDAQGF